MKRKVVIIGGGASGLVAGIFAARQGAEVMILEHKEAVGKKILATGNGKCNLTNLNIDQACYFGNQPSFAMQVIEQFNVFSTLEFFEELGIYPKIKQGYVYPRSEQASSVRALLLKEAERLEIKIVTLCKIQRIVKESDRKFQIETNQGFYRGDALVLAAGSKASPITGSDGSGYDLAKAMGHHIIKPLPALVQLRCMEKHYKQLAGVRTDVKLKLMADGDCISESFGELQLTEYGISGIPTFQISRHAAVALARKQKVVVEIDFFPEKDYDNMKEYFITRIKNKKAGSGEDFLTGIFNKKLAAVLLKLAGISVKDKIGHIPRGKWECLFQNIKFYKTTIISTNPYENAQVCCGGVDTSEVDQKTLVSLLTEGLYFCGEILDVDGICGGYNLQFAWSSGKIAGVHAGKG